MIEDQTVTAAQPTSNSTGALIRLQDVSLRFRRYGDYRPTLKQSVLNRIFRRNYKSVSDFLLYDQLNLTVLRGDRLGIVGHNGAGKSTLLKMISGIYRPSTGRVHVRGKVAPLIELGAGFNPELSGVENVFLNGAVLGFSPEQMAAKLDSIFEFSGLKEFANTPVKYYSSGMVLRLGFSIATDIDPEILLIDEIFAAGDREFTAKARARMLGLLECSHIVVLVSHSIPLIRELCNRVIWLDHGKVLKDGPANEVCDAYESAVTHL